MSGARIAIVDSGVNAEHPHVGGVAGGIGFGPDGCAQPDFVDRLGHGTAVTAVIREKAPLAEIFVAKVFDRSLRAEVAALAAALDWAVARGVGFVNLSLGTTQAAHAPALRDGVARAVASGVLVVSAWQTPEGEPLWPGRLPGVLAVGPDWQCPRDAVREERASDGTRVWCASAYPRPIPGVPCERNLKGSSFAVANVTGLLAATLGGGRVDLARAARGLEALGQRGGQRGA